MGIKLRTPAGGSLELKADDTLATDEVVEIPSDGNFGIESGSNSNGSWIKFPDGTMMQYGVVTIVGSDTIVYPLDFIDTNYSFTALPDNTVYGYCDNGAKTVNSIDMYVKRDINDSNEYSSNINWQAIGRWK